VQVKRGRLKAYLDLDQYLHITFNKKIK